MMHWHVKGPQKTIHLLLALKSVVSRDIGEVYNFAVLVVENKIYSFHNYRFLNILLSAVALMIQIGHSVILGFVRVLDSFWEKHFLERNELVWISILAHFLGLLVKHRATARNKPRILHQIVWSTLLPWPRESIHPSFFSKVESKHLNTFVIAE